MPFWDGLFASLFGGPPEIDTHAIGNAINPATSLPMVGDGFGGLDVCGSPYGTDIHSMHNESNHSVGPTWGDSIF